MFKLIAQLAVAEEHPVLRFTISRRSLIAHNIGRQIEDSAKGGGVLSDYDSAKTTAGAARTGVVRRTPTAGFAARRFALPEMRIAAESRAAA
jgi:hypothetical protein